MMSARVSREILQPGKNKPAISCGSPGSPSMRTAVVIACFAAFLAMGWAHAQQPMIIKFSHVVSPDAPKGKAAVKFKELAEQYTNGKVKVEGYPNSSLYKHKEEL